jgi:hypothetical protein
MLQDERDLSIKSSNSTKVSIKIMGSPCMIISIYTYWVKEYCVLNIFQNFAQYKRNKT